MDSDTESQGQGARKAWMMDSLVNEDKKIGHLIAPTKLVEGLIKTEVNLEKLPFFSPNKNRYHRKSSITLEKKRTVAGGHEITVSWRVIPHQEYGWPNYFDRDVYRAIQKLINEHGVAPGGFVPFTYRQLCRIMRLSYSGKTVNEIRESIKRIKFTGVESHGAFRFKGKGGIETVNDTFSIFERLVEYGGTMPDGSKADTNFLFLGTWYIQSIRSGYLKALDMDFHFSLKSPLARSLYAFLDVMFYGVSQGGGGEYRKRYGELCREIFLTRQRYKSKVLKILSPAIEELKQRQYLDFFAILDIEGEKQDWWLVFRPGPRFHTPDQFNHRQIALLFDGDDGKPESQHAGKADKQKGVAPPITNVAPAFSLVKAFHQRAGRPKHRPTKKEIAQVEPLLAIYGEAGVQAIIDMAFEQARTTNYDMKRFGAIAHFVEEYAESVKMELPERLEAQGRGVVEKQALRAARDVFEAYKALRFAELAGYKKKIGKEVWDQRFAESLEAVRNKNAFTKSAKVDSPILQKLAEETLKAAVLDELGVPSWETYASEHGLDPALAQQAQTKIAE